MRETISGRVLLPGGTASRLNLCPRPPPIDTSYASQLSICQLYSNGAYRYGRRRRWPGFLARHDGAVVKGNETIVKMWGDIYKEPTTHKCTVGGARAEGDGVWAYGEVTITGNPGGHVRWTAFDIKQNGQWKVQMLHVSPIKEKE
jgi:hypothetical protein